MSFPSEGHMEDNGKTILRFIGQGNMFYWNRSNPWAKKSFISMRVEEENVRLKQKHSLDTAVRMFQSSEQMRRWCASLSVD